MFTHINESEPFFETHKLTSLKILSTVLMILGIVWFAYFYDLKNLHFTGTVGLFSLIFLFLGGLIWWIPVLLGITNKKNELTFETVRKQTWRFMLSGLITLYLGGTCFIISLWLYHFNNSNISAMLPFFILAVIFFMIGLYFLIQRRMIKDHYELKKHQQQILDGLEKINNFLSKTEYTGVTK